MIIAVTAAINGVVFCSALIASEQNVLMTEAESTGDIIDEWLVRQAGIVETMKSTLQNIDKNDKDAFMDFLEANLANNNDALMYYCCFGYNGGVLPADHSILDLDPTTRSWWTDAIAKDGLIYTAPYTDFATGQMIVSITVPCMIGGEQAVVLADYEKLEKLADNYKEDADYYAQVSGILSSNTKELRNSISNINEILGTINLSQKELDQAVQSVNQNLQEITYASETVSGETQDVMNSVSSLQETIGQLQI